MRKMEKGLINSVIAGLATGFTYVFGGWDTALIILITFMVIDYLTGVIYGITQNQLSSEIGFKGIAKKVGIVFLVAVGVSLDRLMDNKGWVFRTLVCYFYIANEGISILENISNLGLPIPKKLQDVLIQLKDTTESRGDNDTTI